MHSPNDEDDNADTIFGTSAAAAASPASENEDEEEEEAIIAALRAAGLSEAELNAPGQLLSDEPVVVVLANSHDGDVMANVRRQSWPEAIAIGRVVGQRLVDIAGGAGTPALGPPREEAATASLGCAVAPGHRRPAGAAGRRRDTQRHRPRG